MRSDHSAPPRLVLLVLALLAGAGCQRLNPSWCDEVDRCPLEKYCDPRTNTCQPREAGLMDSSTDFPATDSRSDAPAEVGLPDANQDLPDLRELGAADSTSCSGDLWVCYQGVVIQRCTEAGLVEQRICPDGLCADGHCQPAPGALECQSSRQCVTSQLCTLFLGPGGTLLRRCAAAVPGFVGAGACSSGLDCATGLCTLAGRCYHACALQTDCPLGFSCQAIQLPLEGQLVATTSCAP